MSDLIEPEFTKPDWDYYRGNNHHVIPPPRAMRMGSVSFARHLGKPLSDALWEDLMHRLGISKLRIYGPNCGRWLDGGGSGCCWITLDEHDNVADIEFNPYIFDRMAKLPKAVQ